MPISQQDCQPLIIEAARALADDPKMTIKEIRENERFAILFHPTRKIALGNITQIKKIAADLKAGRPAPKIQPLFVLTLD